jgi:TonB family protein
VPIKAQRAIYPYEAQEQHLQGQVMVKILVSKTGDVVSADAVSGDPILSRSAVNAVKKWKFKPFIKTGKPVTVSTTLPFDFAFSGNVHDQKVPPANANATPASGEASQSAHISHEVSVGLLLHKVQPVYPPEARRAHIQGTVVLRAEISKDGHIADLQPISGPEESIPAAIGAVQQGRYRPYLLAGNPVEVVTEITVNARSQDS